MLEPLVVMDGINVSSVLGGGDRTLGDARGAI
jgi:hypothetical protein